MPKRAIIGLFLFVIGLTAIIVRRNWLAHLIVCPVELAFPTSVGHFTTGDFTINVDYRYVADLRLQKQATASDATSCLPGLANPGQKCAANESILKLKSAVYSQNRLVREHVDSPGCHWGPDIVCGVISFQGQAGRTYRIDVDVLKDTSALASANPKLVVCPHREFGEDWGATYFYVEPLAALCAVVGLFLLGSSVFAVLRR